MEDLNDKIARLLADPASMDKIRATMAALGSDMPAEDPPPPQPQQPPPPPTGGGLPDLSMLAKVAPLMGAFNKDDDDTRLLQALRPYLHGEREQRLDETMRMLKLTKLLPLLQEQGIFGK